MPETLDDTASRLWWGIRKYLWVLFITVPLAAGILLAASPGNITREYQTSALVIAKDRGPIATDSMARMYESVFNGGTVAEEAVRLGDLPINPRDLIPDYASLDPVENNIVANVIGAHSDPGLAKQIADRAADALVAELNTIFKGNAEFVKVGSAAVPEEAVTSVSRVAPLILGTAVGLIAGLGMIGLLLTLRRPVLSADEASALVGSPLVGTPTLPPSRGLPPLSSQVPGLAATVKRLLPDAVGTVVFITHTRGEVLRTTMAQLVAGMIGRNHPTFLVASHDAHVQYLYEHLETGPNLAVTNTLPDVATWTRMPIIIDGPSARGSDAPQLIPEFAQIVLVAQQGVSRARILEVSSQFLPGELAGVLFVRRGSVWPWLAGPHRTPVRQDPVASPELGRPARDRDSERPASPAQPRPGGERVRATDPVLRQSSSRGEAETGAADSRQQRPPHTTVPKVAKQPSFLGQGTPQQTEIRLDDPEPAQGDDSRTAIRTAVSDEGAVKRSDPSPE